MTYVTVTGLKLIKSLLLSASSDIETLPLCFMNFATSSSSFCEMYINFPLSSITPVSSPLACKSVSLSIAA